MELNFKKDRYSIVVYPHNEIISKVEVFKGNLADKVGRYASQNSAAHITLVEFEANLKEFNFYKQYTKRFCYSQKSRSILFDQLIISQKNGAVIVLPSPVSKHYFKDLLAKFRKGLKSKKVVASSSAHISIGRNLNADQIEIASHIFNDICLDFVCERIAIRKFNSIKGQYEIIYEFYFLGNEPMEGQLCLFQ